VSGWLRRAGHVRAATGEGITWSVAEGRRGRRWRELIRVGNGGPGIRHSLLLETDPGGRFSHLELSTDAGLFTIHPEADGTLHGNGVVDHGEADLRDAAGVEHVRGLVWPDDGVVLVEGSLVCRLAAIHALRDALAPSAARSQAAAWIPLSLWLEIRPVRVERLDARRWRFGGGDVVEVDSDGLPVLDAGTTWPLEASD
jgi:hypothetical protein